MNKYINDAWEMYLKNVVPKNASDTQIKETKQAFFSGASILFTTIMNVMDSDDEPTENDLQIMTDINNEISMFGQKLDREMLGIIRH